MFIEPPNLIIPGITAFFTTKSSSDEEAVRVYFKEKMDGADIYMPVQKHTDIVHVLRDSRERVIADAVITSRRKTALGVKVADCVPILLFDRKIMAVGAVHAGWRGTASGILRRTIEKMNDEFGSIPNDILTAIGPGIKGCSYEVSEDVKAAVEAASGYGGYFRKAGEKYFIDLPSANRLQAVSAGIPRENIWQSRECTFCAPEKFHSYRRSGEGAGRQSGFIVMW
ncbi:MAG: peptidoglycan editing factor PgeF [Nitrospirae bacterium]|nr:peptidoglycan editing factor PgeF [Nitrospirota bacterium]